ncbi:MAG: hypothetical protein EOP34_09940 [Rickettsiales bacterium]|nr:MAG: hypothetical protein EOP34_09940 [Rickettsiales bacterium]
MRFKNFLYKLIYFILIIFYINIASAYGPPGNVSNLSTNITEEFSVKYNVIEANGYYLELNNNKPPYDNLSPNNYSKWYNTNISVIKGQTISFNIEGLVATVDNRILDFDPTIPQAVAMHI